MNTHLQLSLKISILHILDINIGDNDEMNILKMVNGKIIYYPNTKIISIIEINKLSQSWALFLWRRKSFFATTCSAKCGIMADRFIPINNTYNNYTLHINSE